ncbi:hypothetical protein Val02_26910 [Virgisporangium aliadipatigenens]|uniref:Uncharacterized protein n=1 Tax=Virgisporangium aliadipatigenens TaxID=741659 RepID=A0A8J4DPC2_9ACTN|nr:hypothetical protein [Virgisporangium aliadipatigenens]GIJ45805.1 hypothetical protein Val02_26910 [Virgisporangium aliadipatigenens]
MNPTPELPDGKLDLSKPVILVDWLRANLGRTGAGPLAHVYRIGRNLVLAQPEASRWDSAEEVPSTFRPPPVKLTNDLFAVTIEQHWSCVRRVGQKWERAQFPMNNTFGRVRADFSLCPNLREYREAFPPERPDGWDE